MWWVQRTTTTTTTGASGKAGKGSGGEAPGSSVASVEEASECVDLYVRRDRHGGFGIFLEEGGVGGVIRGIEPLASGEDGRSRLEVGDTIIRVGGAPTETAAAVAEMMSSADQVLSITVAKTRRGGSKVAEPEDDIGDVSTRFADPLALGFRVPWARLTWLVEASSSPRDGKNSSGDYGKVVASAARRALHEESSGGSTARVAAAVGRELARVSEVSAKVAKQCEAATTLEPAHYARAALRVSRVCSAFASGAKAVAKPEFLRSARFTLNVPALLCPEVVAASRCLVPLSVELARLPFAARFREGSRCLREVERRERRAVELAALTRGLRDASVRELSETDLDATVTGAFEALRDGVRACRDARNISREAHKACVAAARETSDGVFSTPPRPPPVGTTSPRSAAFEMACEAAAAASELRLAIDERLATAVAIVDELHRNCDLDADEAKASVAAAECTWAVDDATTRATLAAELGVRETELAAKAKTMATLLENHARQVVDLADAARDRLVACLDDQTAGLPRYFDLADDSIRARADLVRRQIRDRERIIAAFDDARSELNLARRDVEDQYAAATAFRRRTRANLERRLALLEAATVAAKRAAVLKRSLLADAPEALKHFADHILAAAADLANLDVDLRLAHARLAALALRVELARAHPNAARVLTALLDGVNSTKFELHRIREDRPEATKAVELSLADLAQLELLAASAVARSAPPTPTDNNKDGGDDDTSFDIFKSPYDGDEGEGDGDELPRGGD
ncbi:hypothetical protein CTAYLR_005220 [Chrysophaeum taylorii]|uniref:PDZ domain-containing protein n=1 Tax=Chrysophaeum taylorii TaxID=2483200 RepID=A0AAD7UB27_9STRA|nr:hypothetical protein CTAYLR_005220 [Chrysophaeum taylorii]